MKSKITLGIMLTLLSILPGLIGNLTSQAKTESSSEVRQGVHVDLNALMFEQFQKWDALCTRYLSTNATVSDMWDYTRAPENYDKASLCSPTNYLIAMASFYEATGGSYYIHKICVMVDTYMTTHGIEQTQTKELFFMSISIGLTATKMTRAQWRQ